jgi:hypothetical protein
VKTNLYVVGLRPEHVPVLRRDPQPLRQRRAAACQYAGRRGYAVRTRLADPNRGRRRADVVKGIPPSAAWRPRLPRTGGTACTTPTAAGWTWR